MIVPMADWPRAGFAPSRVFWPRVYTEPKSSAIITAPGEKCGLGGIAVLLVVLGIGSSVGAFVLAYILGIAFLPELEPASVLYLWDGVIVGFLLARIAGLLLQLQLRGEALSLGKLLPMPVPLASAFLVNYVGSQLRVSLLIFLGLMLGLALASVSALGASNLILIPLARISHQAACRRSKALGFH